MTVIEIIRSQGQISGPESDKDNRHIKPACQRLGMSSAEKGLPTMRKSLYGFDLL